MAAGASAQPAVDDWQDVNDWKPVTKTPARPELPSFPIDAWVSHHVKDLPPEQQMQKRAGFTAVWDEMTRGFRDLGYSATSGLNRGMASFTTELELLAQHFGRATKSKREDMHGGNSELDTLPENAWFAAARALGGAVKEYEANAELLQNMLPKEGLSALDKVYQWGGESAGQMIPGTAQFLMDRASAFTIPFAVGDEAARLRGDAHPLIAGLTKAAEVGMLATMFKMVEPLKAWMKAGVLGTYFGADQAINAKPGERAKGFLEGAATGGLLGITTPGGKYGIRDLYPEIGRDAPQGATAQPEPVPQVMPEGLKPVAQKATEGQQAALEKVGTESGAASDTALFQQAKQELGPDASVSAIALRAQELKGAGDKGAEPPKQGKLHRFVEEAKGKTDVQLIDEINKIYAEASGFSERHQEEIEQMVPWLLKGGDVRGPGGLLMEGIRQRVKGGEAEIRTLAGDTPHDRLAALHGWMRKLLNYEDVAWTNREKGTSGVETFDEWVKKQASPEEPVVDAELRRELASAQQLALKQPEASVQGPDTKAGFTNPDGEALDGEQAKEWVKKNEPDVYKELPEGEKLNADEYNQARDTVEARRRPLPLGAASALPMDNPPIFTPRTEPTGIWGAVGRVFHSMYKAVTIDILPALSDAGISNNAVQHAHARAAVPKIVDDMLARVFPEEYKNPGKMAPFIDLLNKDNILGGYDAFLLNASEARKAGDDATAAKWERLADKVQQVHDLQAYDAEVQKARGNKKFMETVGRWQDNVSPRLDQLYNEMKQVDTFTQRDSRGRYLDSRINLLSEDVAARWTESLANPDQPMPEPSASSYRNPNVKRDPTDIMATFTGEYSTDAKAVLSSVVGHRWSEVTKLRFYNDLVNTVAIKAEGQEAPEGYSRMSFKVPQTDNSGRTKTVEQSLFVPKGMVREIRSVLATDMRLQQNIVGKVLTGIQLAQLADLTTHTKNIVSVVTRAQGAGDIWADVGRKIPVLGSVDALWRLAKTTREVLQDTPEMRAEIAQMARRGLVRPEFPSTGLQKITRGQQIIHEADTAARVVMNRFFDNLVERKLAVDTEENRRGFVNQVGEYNSRLEGPIMKAAKESGIAPFIVAGRNFNRQGRWAITGNPGVEAASMNAAVQMRTLNLLGTAALFTLPMLLNYLTTNKMAGRSGTPVGAWDLGLDPDDNGKHKVVDLLSWTGARRGMRSIGLDALAQGLMNGDHWNDIAGNALQDAGNTVIHPWNGPAVAFAEKTATGKQLDIRGKMEAEKVPEGGGLQFLENFRAALESQNPLVYSIVRPAFQEAGLDQKVKPGYGKDVVTNFLKSPSQAIGMRDMTPPPTAMERRKRDLEVAKEHAKKDMEYEMGVSRKDQKRRFTILKRRAASGE